MIAALQELAAGGSGDGSIENKLCTCVACNTSYGGGGQTRNPFFLGGNSLIGPFLGGSVKPACTITSSITRYDPLKLS
jgi:hypothetical protein